MNLKNYYKQIGTYSFSEGQREIRVFQLKNEQLNAPMYMAEHWTKSDETWVEIPNCSVFSESVTAIGYEIEKTMK